MSDLNAMTPREGLVFMLASYGGGPHWEGYPRILRSAIDALDRAEADRVAAVEAENRRVVAAYGVVTRETIIQALRLEREACAVVAESVTERQHIAHDICGGGFPKRSDTRDFIAAAIRARGDRA